VDIYIKTARELGLAITDIFETHIHADLVSGARELAARLWNRPRLRLSSERDTSYGFDCEPIQDGFKLELGETSIIARHTPGHTPEHISYLLVEEGRDMPWAVLSGDCLFADSVGRPDLLKGMTDRLLKDLFDSLTHFYLGLDDAVIVYPGHGSGSPCGANIASRLSTTIGYERRFNPFLNCKGFEEFRALVTETLPPIPNYYPVMKKVNQAGPEIVGELQIAGLSPAEFKREIERGEALLLDTRSILSFGGGHIPGAINIGARPILSVWAGWLLPSDKPLLLVLEDDTQLYDVLPLLIRTGYTAFAGYLAGGMAAWIDAGYEIKRLNQLSVQEVRSGATNMTLLDVRTEGEWMNGHIPGALHIPLPDLQSKAKQTIPKGPVAVYCGSGYRASIAGSILLNEGYEEVWNIPGSFSAWKNNDYPIEGEAEALAAKG